MGTYNPDIKIDPQEMRLDDVEYLLDVSGKEDLAEVFSVLEAEKLTKEAIKIMANLIYVTQRVLNPEFTLQDAMELPMKTFNNLKAVAENPMIEETEGDSI